MTNRFSVGTIVKEICTTDIGIITDFVSLYDSHKGWVEGVLVNFGGTLKAFSIELLMTNYELYN